MPKMRRKSDLPVKTCTACGRPMVWRKAWEKTWDQVKFCSDACRKGKPRSPDQSAPTNRASLPKV